MAAFALVFVLGAVSMAQAQPAGTLTPGGVRKSASPNPATPATPEAAKPLAPKPTVAEVEKPSPAPSFGHEGLKVHGHWDIDIRNPDGTLAQHHEYENSLQYDGANYLVGLMSGYAVAGDYEIFFASSGCTGSQYPFCAIAQSTTVQPGLFACSVYVCVGGLTVTPTFGTGPTLKLSGSITMPSAGTISAVYTGPYGCSSGSGFPTAAATVTPAQCSTGTAQDQFSGTMTGTSEPNIVVAAGQLVQIVVTISFS